MQVRRSNADRSQATREALITAARSLFLEHGFAATGTPDVVERAGVTRGALYHHFKDKKALFQAVLEAEAKRIASEIEKESSGAPTPVAALIEGGKAYFDAMKLPGRVEMMLLEGPAVLGASVMRQIDLQTGGLELRRGIAAVAGNTSVPEEIEAIADLASAMFDRAALACNGGADRGLYEMVLERMLLRLARDARGSPPAR